MLSLLPSIEVGVITAFAGGLGNIPTGWFLCDGANGTPDLRNKFVVATGPIFSVGDEGGTFTHGHDFTADNHDHDLPVGTDVESGADVKDTTMPSEATGTIFPIPKPLPYYALAYIMYVGE